MCLSQVGEQLFASEGPLLGQAQETGLGEFVVFRIERNLGVNLIENDGTYLRRILRWPTRCLRKLTGQLDTFVPGILR